MIRSLSLVSVCIFLYVAKIEGSQIVSAPSFLANYASSYNSHVVSHDVRYPVSVSPVAVAPVVRSAPTVSFSQIVDPGVNVASVPVTRLTSQPLTAPIAQPISTYQAAPISTYQFAPQFSAVAATPVQFAERSSLVQPISAYQVAPLRFPATLSAFQVAPQFRSVEGTPVQFAQRSSLAQPISGQQPAPLGSPAFQLAPQFPPAARPQVEVSGRSSQNNQLAPNPQQIPNSPELSRSVAQPQTRNELGKFDAPQNSPVPSAVLASSQFLARRLSPQGANQQISNRQEVNAPVPQQQTAPLMQALFRSQQGSRFLVASSALKNTERLDGDDSESVEVNSSESTEDRIPNRKDLQPSPKTRIVFSPTSVIGSPLVPNAYAQVITF